MNDELILMVLLTADQVRARVLELAAEIDASCPEGRHLHRFRFSRGASFFSPT